MELIILVGLGALLLFWVDSMRARERALLAARTACRRHDLQLLDYTVALARIRPRRDSDGRVRLFRCYGFEFSTDGGSRHRGEVDIMGARAGAVRLELDEFTLHDSN